MKIFCIGANKTGTTSLQKEFERLGYSVGSQPAACRLLREYAANNFEPIIDYCRTADVFQDFPFSYPNTFKYLDEAYPNSKFILSVRNSPEEWYGSVVGFHSKLLNTKSTPTAEHLKNHNYIWKGWMWEAHKVAYNITEENPYDKDILMKFYIDYNNSVLEYFKDNDNLLVINLAEENSYQRFLEFLNIDSPFKQFPHKNKSR